MQGHEIPFIYLRSNSSSKWEIFRSVFYSKEGHDIAALKIITEEAGGKVTDLNGRERRYDSDGCGCIVSNGVLHDKILEIVKKSKLESN